MSVTNIYNDYNKNKNWSDVNKLDVSDAIVASVSTGIAIFALVSNPVGWVATAVIAAEYASTIYFSYRTIQELKNY